MMGVTSIKQEALGRVVISKQGRDKGRYFVVLQVINDNHVSIADGDLRKVEKPKIKNIKHIQFTNTSIPELVESLQKGEIPTNNMVRRSLKRFLDESNEGEGGLVNG